MKVFTKGKNGKHCGLFDGVGELCSDTDDPHYRAAAQPKAKRKPTSASGVPKVSLTVYTPSSLRKRSVMNGKVLRQHCWRYREQGGKSNKRLRRSTDSKAKQRAKAQGELYALTTTNKVNAITGSCLRRVISAAYGQRSRSLEGFYEYDCGWCNSFTETLPMYGQLGHADMARSRKLCAMSPPDCEGAIRLLQAFSQASQLSDGARELCGLLLRKSPPPLRAAGCS